jgi:hypothetical protein
MITEPLHLPRPVIRVPGIRNLKRKRKHQQRRGLRELLHNPRQNTAEPLHPGVLWQVTPATRDLSLGLRPANRESRYPTNSAFGTLSGRSGCCRYRSCSPGRFFHRPLCGSLLRRRLSGRFPGRRLLCSLFNYTLRRLLRSFLCRGATCALRRGLSRALCGFLRCSLGCAL